MSFQGCQQEDELRGSVPWKDPSGGQVERESGVMGCGHLEEEGKTQEDH